MQTIVLTGATGGLGSALAKEIISKNCGELICIYRNENKFRKIFSEVHTRIHPYPLSPDDTYDRLMDMISDIQTDEIVLILNAFSIIPLKRVGEYTHSDIEQMIDTNIKQNVRLINRITDLCSRTPLALRIINLDSGAADFPLTGWGNYCAAKAYINSFLSVIALENPTYRIVSFDPGVMDTNMQKQIRDTDRQIFDQVDQFISYKENNNLLAPSVVADELIERYVVHWTAKDIREKYKS